MEPTRGARLLRWAGFAALGAAAFLLTLTRIDITGEGYGLYLVREAGAVQLRLNDDLLLGQGERAVGGISFSRAREIAHADDRMSRRGPYLESEWNEALGRGVVRNHLVDGTVLVTLLSRYENGGGDGGVRHGVFVGGSLPDVAMDVAAQNQSGMAFRDQAGKWRHLWCNANEAVWDVDRGREIDTWEYAFLESHVAVRDTQRVVIKSSHEIAVAGVPVRMDRVAFFTAGEPYFDLAVTLENVGSRPVRYLFLYGDEPWVGSFGTSTGNLGWTEEGVFADESSIDARRLRGAGIVDSGSGTANFLAWFPENVPDVVYVSNEMGRLNPGVPLASNEIFIGLEWRDRVLAPGELHRFRVAIGMADRDLATGRLRIPPGVFDRRY
jgi:hypothetical protein